MGALQPSFRLVNEYLSSGSPDEAKAHGDSLTRQGPVDFRTVENTAGTTQLACSLLSPNIDDSLGGFSVILSIMHETDIIILRNIIFSLIFSPKILWELMLLRFLVWGCQLSLQTPELF